jgi:hypothetical protein
VNNDFQIYRVVDENGIDVYSGPNKTLNMYSSFKTSSQISANASILSRGTESMIKNLKYGIKL